MTEAHWFANICPFFSVHDLDCINEKFGKKGALSAERLWASGLNRAAQWLVRNGEVWTNHLQSAEKSMGRNIQGDFRVTFWGEADFPAPLKNLSFPPAVLFSRGDLSCLNGPVVSIVGARHPTDLGRLWVKNVVKELVANGLTIVSGGARGIDGEAHFAALQAGGKTMAFLPGGVDRPYPAVNSYIFEKMEKAGGMISEYLPGTSVRAENFHRRNRLIAGASSIVVIVEAGLKSGTMMTAMKALSENREVLVVPGPPMVASYAGSLELLRQGAVLVRDAKDILATLKLNATGELV